MYSNMPVIWRSKSSALFAVCLCVCPVSNFRDTNLKLEMSLSVSGENWNLSEYAVEFFIVEVRRFTVCVPSFVIVRSEIPECVCRRLSTYPSLCSSSVAPYKRFRGIILFDSYRKWDKYPLIYVIVHGSIWIF